MKLIINVEHGWNSTYAMLDCVYDNRNAISIFCDEHFPEVQISSYDWIFFMFFLFYFYFWYMVLIGKLVI